MFVVEEVYTRPHDKVKFWTGQSQYRDDVSAAAIEAGDLIVQQLGVTDNPLVAKYRAIWRNRAAWQRWVGDDVVLAIANQMVADYHAVHGITTERFESGS